MAVKYHINPQRGPLPCSAKTPEGCRYGADTVHYDSTESARHAWEAQLGAEYGSTVAHSSRSAPPVDLPLVRPYDLMAPDEVAALIETDRSAYDDVVIATERATRRTDEAWSRLLAHKEPEPYAAFAGLVDEYNAARQDAALMESARQGSPFAASRLRDALSTDVVNRFAVAARLANSRPGPSSPSDTMVATLLGSSDPEARESFYRQVWGFHHLADQVEAHSGKVSVKDGFALVEERSGRVHGIAATPGLLSVSKNKVLIPDGVESVVVNMFKSAPEISSWTVTAFRDHRGNVYTGR